MLSSNMLMLNLILLIEVTFSTPTGVYTQNPHRGRVVSVKGIFRQLTLCPERLAFFRRMKMPSLESEFRLADTKQISQPTRCQVLALSECPRFRGHKTRYRAGDSLQMG